MKQLYLVANWKSNKTVEEAIEWIRTIQDSISHINIPKTISVILCPPFTVLAPLKEEINKNKLPIYLSAQNISPFGKGAYTGEINVDMVKNLVDYVLIGHSERRKYFREQEEELNLKVLQSHSANFQTIYCIEEEQSHVPASVDIIAYEPITSIGSGKAEDPKAADLVCEHIAKRNGQKPVLYGGSVTEKNMYEFISMPSIAGVLVGGASLDPDRFFQMIQRASSL